MGAPGSFTAIHKDHYHNLHAVLTGAKVFTIAPPTDIAFLRERPLRAGTFLEERSTGLEGGGTGAWQVLPDPDGAHVPWLTVDVGGQPGSCGVASGCPMPLASLISRVSVRVGRGDVLFLPAFWLHAVENESLAIAVNHWFNCDEAFTGPAWAAMKIARALAPVLEAEAASGHANKEGSERGGG